MFVFIDDEKDNDQCNRSKGLWSMITTNTVVSARVTGTITKTTSTTATTAVMKTHCLTSCTTDEHEEFEYHLCFSLQQVHTERQRKRPVLAERKRKPKVLSPPCNLCSHCMLWHIFMFACANSLHGGEQLFECVPV